MYPPTAPSPRAYRTSAVLGASPGARIVMLYDGARRFLHQAAAAKRGREVEATHRNLRRAEDILLYLRQILDTEHGEIPGRLHAIYLFCEGQLLQARFEHDPTKIENVIAILGPLREAWAVAERHATPAAQPQNELA